MPFHHVRGMFDFDSHERRVLAPLLLAGFFEQYDATIIGVAGPVVAKGLGVSVAVFGIGVAVIRIASLASVPFLRLADQWGRQRLLVISIAVFTLSTGLTAAAWSLAAFVVVQSVCRVFLTVESSLAALVVAEEIRPDRRGAGLSMLGMISGIGGAPVALLLLVVDDTSLGWRILYLFALLPLGVVAYLRRNLGETRAFEVARESNRVQAGFWPHVDRLHRSRLWRAAVLAGAFGCLVTPATLYAAQLAQDTYHWKGLFTAIVIGAGPWGFLGFLIGGRLSDRLGRRRILLVAFAMMAGGTVLVFTRSRATFAPGYWLIVASLAATSAVTQAYLAELFSTEVRATCTSFVLACQVLAGSLGLLVVGALAATVAPATQFLFGAGGLLVAGTLVRGLPETAGADVIGEIAADPGPAGGGRGEP